ncbi:5'-deoxynucleotidase VC_1978 [Vibrio crassostreae]|uniref:5'-deoxynucleotidase n=1 Tax=Vibrio crassostreae TaxID=246167 RepID=UPI001BD54B09|nr:5'-deoxynucleotidase [Vibrio crassostreae]CAK1757623.1 5'-deoxynucleotidase VC_1978 [Vibrio crassostreae]CAK1757700.1 5'-deoxynucleotidase VC_1978 [Vibrio crassostreae]CAK2376107.1 5'-deoxynucleotidase VC_1978 [Vibrio crassostreae]CAK2386559.1 5'-deoxynucleotidase VC_1978 [Vibrio crassostreae]CAK2386588.1 5'-deoxynucleotidase VC_1978 [Vibrio crassostreae]
MNQQQSTFMAWVTRMPLIKRWALMHCFQEENVSEHCHQVAVIAHLLTVIKNKRYGGNLSPDRAAVVAIYHEISETKLQDINSKTKYHSPEFTIAFKKLEDLAEQECLDTLPEDLREDFSGLLIQRNVDAEYKEIVKAADIISAYIKTMNELRFHNDEFQHVKEGLDFRINKLTEQMPEVNDFMNIFCNSCTTTLDKISG